MIRPIPCLLWMCCVLTACQAGSGDPPDSPAHAQPAAGAEATTLDDGSAPAELATIAGLLRARHIDDLPSAEQLARYPSAEASLVELARKGETMLVRTRALTLLRHFHSESTGALLIEIVSDAQAHPALRAGAVTGLAGQPLDQHPERLAIVVAALADADPRVGVAAVEVLATFKAGREALRDAAGREDLGPTVRAAIESR